MQSKFQAEPHDSLGSSPHALKACALNYLGRNRTCYPPIISRMLYLLSYHGDACDDAERRREKNPSLLRRPALNEASRTNDSFLQSKPCATA